MASTINRWPDWTPPPPGSPLFPPPPSPSRACCTRDLGFVGWVLARFGVLLGSWFSGVGEICDLAVDQVKSLRWKNACVSRSIFLRDPWCVVGDSSPTSSSRSWVGLGSLCIWGCLIPDFLASDPTRGFPPCSWSGWVRPWSAPDLMIWFLHVPPQVDYVDDFAEIIAWNWPWMILMFLHVPP